MQELKQKSGFLKFGRFVLSYALSNYNYVNFRIRKISFWYGKCTVKEWYLSRRTVIDFGQWQFSISLYRFKSISERNNLFHF